MLITVALQRNAIDQNTKGKALIGRVRAGIELEEKQELRYQTLQQDGEAVEPQVQDGSMEPIQKILELM